MPIPEQLSERALERRVRRWLASGPFDGFVQAAPGLEESVARELAALGVETLAQAEGGVAVRLTAAEVMLLNLRLRTASRVLLRFGSFPAAVREMLFDRMRRLPWEVQLCLAGTYRLHMVSRRSALQAGDELQ
ncbi:MAG TPA: THUMP domain-containing protein, partial [Deinococcales bacterium]|nr:THUMP domain-containing protein [Deinococcales bacterium]